MKNLNISLKNCYGIKELNTEFNFSNSNTQLIYAPNGTMKTSLAKTFQDIELGEPSKDLIFINRESSTTIEIDGKPITKDDVMVIREIADNPLSVSDELKKILSSGTLREDYTNVFKPILDNKDVLDKVLIKKLKKDWLTILQQNFNEDTERTYNRIYAELKNMDFFEKFKDLDYLTIFNESTEKLFKEDNFKNYINQYVAKYNELIDKSKFFRKGFDIYNSDKIAKSLKKEGFFSLKGKENHSLEVYTLAGKKTICNIIELEKNIEEEKDAILNDKDAREILDKISNFLKNEATIKLKDLITGNPWVLEHIYHKDFKANIIISYFIEHYKSLENIVTAYDNFKNEKESFKIKIKNQEKVWNDIINDFNDKFNMPFKIDIKNLENVILENNTDPIIRFIYEDKDTKESTTFTDKDLDIFKKPLSNGEKKAFYILEILHKIEARKKSHFDKPTLFIIDDLADSFDYKNKYAIIQYLKEWKDIPNFYFIILTHNFDFYRSVGERLNIFNRFIARNEIYNNDKNEMCYKISFYKETDKAREATPVQMLANNEENIANNKKHVNISNTKKALFLIPLIRNIIEYIEDENSEIYKDLTSLLHYKSDTNNFKMGKLYNIITNTIKIKIITSYNKENDNVIDVLREEANDIINKNQSYSFLEDLIDKVILSIACRIFFEKYAIETLKIDVSDCAGNQFNKICKKLDKNSDIEKLGRKVQLMVSENIHLNSFMYEPLLDVGIDHLKDLLREILDL